ncbi:MAG: sigma-70 family RNA polymerase sigma factor [Chthonomonadales bacterium]|nr:sigma-70 family RNA polymerase sigma factor [Chthonomonadales bacterium]
MVNLLRIRPWVGLAPAQERDLKAEFEQILDLHYRRVYRLIYRMVRNEADAADLTQETFIRVYRALPRLRLDGACAAWIRRIATNLCVDFVRRNKHRQSTSLSGVGSVSESAWVTEDASQASSGDPAHLFMENERARIVHRAVDALPPDYRTVIVLHHLEDMRVDEIADVLQVPVGTVKSRLSRARQALHRRLAVHFSPNPDERA